MKHTNNTTTTMPKDTGIIIFSISDQHSHVNDTYIDNPNPVDIANAVNKKTNAK